MFRSFLLVSLFVTTTVWAKDYTIPTELPSDVQTKMYSLVTDYNTCVLKAPLKIDQRSNIDWRKEGDKALNDCEPKVTALKDYLVSNNVDPALAEGVARRMRTQAARHFVRATMGNMASQASAMEK